MPEAVEPQIIDRRLAEPILEHLQSTRDVVVVDVGDHQHFDPRCRPEEISQRTGSLADTTVDHYSGKHVSRAVIEYQRVTNTGR